MSRAERLLELLQLLREYRYAVTAEVLASKLNISVRSLYRDISSLRAQGAMIEGGPGVGYRLTESYTLPPLSFDDDELLAISLGLKWIEMNTDKALAHSAKRVFAKINAIIPSHSKIKFNHHGITILQGSGDFPNLFEIRKSIQKGLKLEIMYIDGQAQLSCRVIWPCALGFFDESAVIAAWCELRQGFRHFRLDRIQSLKVLEAFAIPPHQLLKQWQTESKIDCL
ncbi:helix-turn-helix transcriptional regulator [Thorsellia kenyensis]|uniref:Helix-turn-helix transcriptional regulator n=1 Tax=Thorsellia kenyensis TaxID=1549888 RepID=A0ABV6C717_9GAMM